MRQPDRNVQRYVSTSLSESRTAIPAHFNLPLDYRRTCTRTALTTLSEWPVGCRSASMQTAKTSARCRMSSDTPETCRREANSTSLQRAQSPPNRSLGKGSEMVRMAKFRPARRVATLVLLLGLSLLTGCAGLGSGTNTSSPAVEISPATASVRAGDTLQFTAKAMGTMNPSFIWSVNGVVGGNAMFGKISTSGLYTALAALPIANSVSIEASSASGRTLSAIPRSRWKIRCRP